MAKKKKKANKPKPSHYPNLKTILMVEKAFKDSETGLLTVAQLKKALPKQVNHNTLIEVLDYLDKSNKIAIGVKGMLWIHNPSLKFQEALRKASTYEEILAKFNR
ncbi:hypothetical protein JXB28_06670 [Candidatus Woesearchaeota archaeon]|nr:hypothetical protein [Candidatus Woesearchaeota archaeon]